MIPWRTQTLAIIRLNFARQFLKSKLRIVILVLFLYSLLPFIVVKSLSASISRPDTHTVSPVVPLPMALDSTSLGLSFAHTYNLSIVDRSTFVSAPTASVLVNFTQFDTLTQTYDYTLTAVTNTDFNLIYLCISSSNCGFSPDINRLADVKYSIDQALLHLGTLKMFQTANFSFKNIFSSLNMYSDYFFFGICTMVISALFEDKKKGLKFGLFTTGIRRSTYYIGLFFTPVFISIIFSIVSLYMFLNLGGDSTAKGPLILLIFSSSFGYIAFAWICAQLVPTARGATLVVALYLVAGVLSQAFTKDLVDSLPYGVLILCCVNPRVALSLYQYIAGFSPSGKGFSSISVPYTAPSVNTLIITSICVTIGLILIATYLDSLEISQDEVRPIYYPIARFFEKPVEAKERDRIEPKLEQVKKEYPQTEKIQINNLHKLYKGSVSKALTSLNLEFYKGEIFGLLGYNGAGKSTFINILCGVISATEGSVEIFGFDAKKNRYDIAATTGVCSQQDILYDSLTTKEHLYYFGLMRGVSNSDINNRIEQLVTDLKIPADMLNTKSMSLSAGQKRKLGVALAFINDPELVVLDEMSSGVDPENRRVIWDFLMKKKKGRAILVCTHFMDEADIVCDRKAMLTLGQLVCVGSSSFLKQIYNTGYTLSVEKGQNVDKQFFIDWFKTHNVQVTCTKSNKEIDEFQISSNDLHLLNDFESDAGVMKMMKSFSIRENGLEQIFTNKELVDEKDITISPQEQNDLLDQMSSFVEPTVMEKTMFYLNFEMKRLYSSLVEIIFRMTFSIMLIVVLWVMIKVEGVDSTTTTTIPIAGDFLNRLLPSQFVMETSVASLLTDFPSRFVPINQTGSSISIGNIVTNQTDYVLTVYGGYAGAPFLAINSLFPSSISTTLEYITIKTQTVTDSAVVMAVHAVLQLLYADLIMNLSEDVADSREKIKFLLLSAGVPLGSYWAVNILRNLLISAIFIVFSISIIPSVYNFNAGVAFIYLLAPSIAASLIGSIFAKSVVRGLGQAIRLVGLLIFIVVLVVGGIKSWDCDSYNIFINVLFYLGPYLPLSVMMASATNCPIPSTGAMYGNVVIWLFVYLLLFVFYEMRHLLIKKIPAADDSFISFNGVTKVFGFFKSKKISVKNLNLKIQKNEMFAFLGPNGCGKTTTLSMLTAQALPTEGYIHMDSLHVASHKLEAIKKIGFCPQFDDLLIANMPVAEHLHLFCAMNGIPKENAEKYIQNLLNAFGIERFKDTPCGCLSGGTKRKVSAAIAVMLPRSLVVLDEASTGLDPLARQKLWNTVRLLNLNRTTIMTTHYISETSYCDKIAIMTEGNLRCCATEYELTKSNANGYKATIEFAAPQANLVDFLRSRVFSDDPEVKIGIDSVVGDIAIVDIKNFKLKLGMLVTRFSKLKEAKELKDFSLAGMTLEHVFLEMVRTRAPVSAKVGVA
ncbi:hypothetical protein HK103_003695 [Boothiomyces macroporosus]|uniref:ABC transporter domain-containing protein n=1 Tax=Boothiomyces macroporosus TaxID=261099 RepID=A0AAD5UI51_9FUNG|nr:hypothetical protein HK103_003695 [Boothiomyces macroporosus]